MAIKHLSNISLEQNELQNAVVHALGTAPTSPVLGQIYFNTGTSKSVFVYTKATGAYEKSFIWSVDKTMSSKAFGKRISKGNCPKLPKKS